MESLADTGIPEAGSIRKTKKDTERNDPLAMHHSVMRETWFWKAYQPT
jgi:hypothetical protein